MNQEVISQAGYGDALVQAVQSLASILQGGLKPIQVVGFATDTVDRSTAATTDGGAYAIPNLSVAANIDANSDYLVIAGQSGYNSGANSNYLQIWQGTVGSGSKKGENQMYVPAGRLVHQVVYIGKFTGGAQTINVGMKVSAGTGHLDGATAMSFLLVAKIN